MYFFNTPFLMILIIIEFTTAYKWKADTLPNPFNQPGPFCNLIESGHPFCDADRLLDENKVKSIIDKQKEISMMGKCPCSVPCKEGEPGLVIGFVTANDTTTIIEKLESMDANSYRLQEFSDNVRKKWNLGTCNNSILITIEVSSRQYGLSIGEKASSILNETWITSVIDESFRDRNSERNFDVNSKIQDILYMYKKIISEELEKSETGSDRSVASLTDSNNNNTMLTIFIICIVVVILIFILIGFILLRHRKENDDVSLRDVWTKKFWSKTGNQYKEAKQSESVNEKDLEKNEDEEIKAKLASTEDLKPVDDIENVDDDKIQYPKLSKV